MKRILVSGLLVVTWYLSRGEPVAGQVRLGCISQPPDHITQKCYDLHTDRLTFSNTSEFCRDNGYSGLANISTEDRAVLRAGFDRNHLTSSERYTWINSQHQRNTTWVSVDGSDVSDMEIAVNTGDSLNCVRLDGKYISTDCQSHLPLVCWKETNASESCSLKIHEMCFEPILKKTEMNWFEARHLCLEENSDLIHHIDGVVDSLVPILAFYRVTSAWFGIASADALKAYDIWQSGSPLPRYSDCLLFDLQTLHTIPALCNQSQNFICEIETPVTQGPTTASAPTTAAPSTSDKSLYLILGVSLGCVLLFIIVAAIIITCACKRKSKDEAPAQAEPAYNPPSLSASMAPRAEHDYAIPRAKLTEYTHSNAPRPLTQTNGNGNYATTIQPAMDVPLQDEINPYETFGKRHHAYSNIGPTSSEPGTPASVAKWDIPYTSSAMPDLVRDASGQQSLDDVRNWATHLVDPPTPGSEVARYSTVSTQGPHTTHHRLETLHEDSFGDDTFSEGSSKGPRVVPPSLNLWS